MLGVGFLALGVLFAAQCVAPAEVVPIGNVVGERDHVLAVGDLIDECICRGAGGAALAGEEFDDGRAGLSQCGQQHGRGHKRRSCEAQ